MIFRTTSRKPVLLAGSGARSAGAAELILEFAVKTHIPVLTTMNGVDLAQGDIHLGFIGTYGNRVSNMILAECDLLLCVGARLGLRQTGHIKERFAPKAELIRADIDQYELSRNIKESEQKHLMDAADFMRRLLAEDIPDYSEWLGRCMEAKELLSDCDREVGNAVMEKIASLLPEDPVVAVDVGQNECWCAQSLALKGHRGRILIGGGYGSMGCGLPYAIGASISGRNGITYCITGDGGLQMNIQELETVVREGLPVKILVVNNHVLGKISEIQQGSYGGRYAQTTARSGYSVPDFEKIAEAYGIKAATLSSYEGLEDYRDWLEDGEPCLLNIILPHDTLLIPKIKWETGKILPEIEEKVLAEAEELLQMGETGDRE